MGFIRMKDRERRRGGEDEKMCAGVCTCGFEGSKKSEQGKQDLLSYRSVFSCLLPSPTLTLLLEN